MVVLYCSVLGTDSFDCSGGDEPGKAQSVICKGSASAKARDAESAEVAFEAAIKSATWHRIGDASIVRKWTMKRARICRMPWRAWLERGSSIFL